MELMLNLGALKMEGVLRIVCNFFVTIANVNLTNIRGLDEGLEKSKKISPK